MTEKKLKRHLRRIWFHYDRLRMALNDAHAQEVIQYDGDYKDEAPCWAADELRDRIRATTMKSTARAIEKEIRKHI